MSTPRQLAIASLTGLADGWAGHFRQDLTRDEVLDELRRIADEDPDTLAEAAATYAVPWSTPRPWYDQAAALLVDAGADPDRVEHWAAVRREHRPRGFSLGRFAEQVNALDSAHGQRLTGH